MVLDALAVSFFALGLMRWRKSGCSRARVHKSRSDPLQGPSSSPVFTRSRGHPSRSDCATEGGVSSYGTLSDMSFAQKSNIYSSDSEDTDSELSAEGGRLRIDSINRPHSRTSSTMEYKGMHASSGNGTGCVLPFLAKNEHHSSGDKTSMTHSSERRIEVACIGVNPVESQRAIEGGCVVDQDSWVSRIWTDIVVEGRYQGLPWISLALLMKIGILVSLITRFLSLSCFPSFYRLLEAYTAVNFVFAEVSKLTLL